MVLRLLILKLQGRWGCIIVIQKEYVILATHIFLAMKSCLNIVSIGLNIILFRIHTHQVFQIIVSLQLFMLIFITIEMKI